MVPLVNVLLPFSPPDIADSDEGSHLIYCLYKTALGSPIEHLMELLSSILATCLWHY